MPCGGCWHEAPTPRSNSNPSPRCPPMLANLPAPIERDSDDLLMFACVLQGSLRDRNEREALKAIDRILHRATVIRAWLPKDSGMEGESTDEG